MLDEQRDRWCSAEVTPSRGEFRSLGSPTCFLPTVSCDVSSPRHAVFLQKDRWEHQDAKRSR